MKKISDEIVHSLYTFNQTLVSIENEIFKLADEQNKVMKKKLCSETNDIHDYELKAVIEFYSDEEQILEIAENMKDLLINTKSTNVCDQQNHNTTSCCWNNKELNSQHHCWLFSMLIPLQ